MTTRTALPRDFHGTPRAALMRAVALDPITGPGSGTLKNQVMFIYNGMTPWLRHLADTWSNHGAVYDTAWKVARCRPWGGPFDPRPAGQRMTCQRPKFCPWCHARRIGKLYDHFKPFFGLPSLCWRLTQDINGRQRDDLRATLRYRLHCLKKPAAWAVVSRVRLSGVMSIEREDRTPWEMALIVAGVPSTGAPPAKGFARVGKPGKMSDEWLMYTVPRVMPYQAALLNDHDAAELMSAAIQFSGRYNETKKIMVGLRDLTMGSR